MKKPIAILILGRSGCGKDTQSKLILENLNFELFISTGSLFRAMAKENTYAGKKISSILAGGELAADWLASFLWQRELIEKIDSNQKNIIFDGVARRLSEAKLLDVVMDWFDIKLVPILIDISKEEARKRLIERGRSDDFDDGITKRLNWYETEVVKVVDYYKGSGKLVVINGMRSIDEVFQDIKEKISKES